MEFNQKYGLNAPKEPENKYGVHFEYKDLYERLARLKDQREKTSKKILFKSVDKGVKRNFSFGSRIRFGSKNCARSNSNLKILGKRNISFEFQRLSKIYSPVNYKKISSPVKFLGSVQFHKSVISTKSVRQRISRSRLNTNQ